MARDADRGDRFVIEESRHAACSTDRVMERILDPNTWSSWQPEIVSIGGPSPLRAGDVAIGRARMLGFDVVGQSRTIEVEDRAFVEDVVVGVRMIVRYRVEEQGSGVVVTRTLEGRMPGGLLGKPLGFLIKRRLRAMQKGVLRALVDQAEAAGPS